MSSNIEGECRSPLLIEEYDPTVALVLRPGGGLSTPGNARCGKKTMFPMTFGFKDAKSPRSPLRNMNLNTNFLQVQVNHTLPITGFQKHLYATVFFVKF